jgi:hypothetical protein
MLVRGWGEFGRKVDGLGGDGADAGVDEAGVAFGARDGDVLTGVEEVGGVRSADDSGNAELSTNDGGVGGAAAVVRDDGGGTLHDGHPVGVRGFRDEGGAVDELVDILASSIRHTRPDTAARPTERPVASVMPWSATL